MGRGRLNSIELLPEECFPVIAWAAEQLQDRDRTQTDIYQDFVSKLEEIEREHRGELQIRIPSFSAFNRYSIRLATMTRRLDETREIASAIAGKFDAKASDDLTLIAAEAIKTLIFELLTSAGESGIDPKGAMALASALHKANQAQSVSFDTKRKVETDFKDKVEKAVDAAEKVHSGSAIGLEAIRKIREDIYGIFEK